MENVDIQSLYKLPRNAIENNVVLGIESTAHTLGLGVISFPPFKILADIRYKYTPREGGLHPRFVAEYMVSKAKIAVEEAFNASGVNPRDLTAIAVALGPGMGPVLRIGATIARALSLALDKPLIPVNHAVAHIEIGRLLCGYEDPLMIYISGGNTQLIVYKQGKYRVVGETLDIPLGNMLDVFARETGIAPPYIVKGKHAIDICAEEGEYIQGLPYTVKGQDLSYSGLLTAALKMYKKGNVSLKDLCFTVREIAFSQLIEVAERALSTTRKKQVLLVGGVAANDYLHNKLHDMASERGVKYCRVEKAYAGDNGVMIAWTGLLGYLHGQIVNPMESYVNQRWRIDKVAVPWIP